MNRSIVTAVMALVAGLVVGYLFGSTAQVHLADGTTRTLTAWNAQDLLYEQRMISFLVISGVLKDTTDRVNATIESQLTQYPPELRELVKLGNNKISEDLETFEKSFADQ